MPVATSSLANGSGPNLEFQHELVKHAFKPLILLSLKARFPIKTSDWALSLKMKVEKIGASLPKGLLGKRVGNCEVS
jgi:hypothetical protein